MSTSPEVLEVRQVLAATLSATLVNGLLTVSDTSLTDTNNSLTTTLVGTNLVITDAHEQFIAAPAGGTLSNGGMTLTIPASLVTSGLTINAGGGDDFVNFQGIDGAFSANLVVDGGSGNDSVGFREGAVNVGAGSINVTTENIDIISAVTAGGAVNLTSTGDDKGFSNFAPITAGADSTFSADKMNINSAITVGAHKLTMIPGAGNGPSDAINIGSTDSLAVDTLELSNAELNRITASQIVIGNADSGAITISAAIELTGDSEVQVVSGYSLLFASGSSWATTNGNLSFSGGGTASGTGHLNGVALDNASVSSSGTGNLSFFGQGGNGGDFNNGIFARFGSTIQSTGTGDISLTGIGGSGTAENRGIQINDASITSTSGDIRLTGQGGQGTDYWNIGVWLVLGANVSASGDARIFIDGTAGSGTDDNNGVLFNGFGYGGATKVTSENGDIEITGQGSTTGTGAGNRGICLLETGTIQSTGAGKITLNGTGGTGTIGARGVELAYDAVVTSVTGEIHITGQGGTTTSGFGVMISVRSIVESTGTAKITIEGTAGDAADANGVYVNSAGSRVSSVDGDITIIGHGGDFLDSGANRGVCIADAAVVQATGSAKIIVNGTGGVSNNSSRGVEIADAGTKVISANGNIEITGQGGAGLYGFGIGVHGTAIVQSTNTGRITLDGTGGVSGGNDGGVLFGGYGSGGSTLTSLNGDITIIGHGGNTGTQGNFNIGVGVFAGSVISSTGMASITIQGTGGTGTDSNRGVEISDGTTKITSQHGDITITGTGGSGVSADRSFNVGVYVHDNAVVESTATEGTAAKITINGTGGAGNGSDVGVWMKNAAAVSSTLGDIAVTGSSNSIVGIFNRGVNLEGASIVSHGTAKITVDGTAGGGDGNEIGVYLERHDSVIQSVDGDISVTGRGGNSVGNNNVGVCLDSGGIIESLGNATIQVNGTGGQSSDSNIGVWVGGVGGAIRSKAGDITVTGTGGQGTSYANIGVVVNRGGVIESTDTARITVMGTGGAGVPTNDFPYGQDGVMVEHANSAIRSKNGDIRIIGTAGGDAGSTLNHGVLLKSGVVETTTGGTANISITGTAGPGSTSFGIQVQSDSGNVGINTSAGNGLIALYSDSINIDFVSQPGAVSAGTQLVAISPLSSNVGINLGGADVSGSLGLTDAELDRITAGALQFGQGSSTGPVTVTSDITRPAATLFQIFQNSDVFISGGLIDTHGGTLLISSSPGPDALYPTHAGVDVIASSTNLSPDLSIAINGPAVDTGYTQLNVVGGVLLGGGKLQLSGGYIPQPNDMFVIVNNDGDEPITGKFDGLAEGAILSFNGRSLQISYVGGSNGNDVVLTSVNLAPVASDASITTDEDTPINDTLVATDVDSPILTYSIAVNPTHGTVTITNTATGAYTYTPDANYNGTDSFMFRAYDGQLNSNLATVSITIVPVNDAPQLNLNGGAVTFSGKAAKQDGPIQIVPNVTVVDPDQSGTSGLGGGTLTVSIDASVKTSKNKVKLHDNIGGISNASSLGTTTGALVSNGNLVLTIQLSAGTTTTDIQAFLRGITFSTKGPGLKLTPRSFHAQLTDAAGAASNLLQQTVNVTK